LGRFFWQIKQINHDMMDEVEIYGLAFKCPFDQRTENCPLEEIDL